MYHLHNSNSKASLQILSTVFLVLLVMDVVSPVVRGQQDDTERHRAFQLYKDARFTEALPLFEKLAAVSPGDREVIETLGLLIIGQTSYLKESGERKQARKRGRELLLRAQKLGADDALLNSLLAAIPPDGGDDAGFSTRKEVEEAMREGEAAFAKGDFPKAVGMYQRALLFDPNLYEAALFTGDVYYQSAEQRKAGEWFARAITINPDRETAYRYWGDSLMKQGRVTEAGDKFVEAYIAEPYSRLARAGIVNWGQRVNVVLAHPKVEIPTSLTPKQDGQLTINLDPKTLTNDKSASGAAWMMYGLIRASWVQSEFAKQYPNEKQYRHSLKEEAAALRAAVRVLAEQKKSDDKSVDPSLLMVMTLDKEGLLEAFILLALPDEGIAGDFAAYRRNNIESLRRYVNQYVLTGGGK